MRSFQVWMLLAVVGMFAACDSSHSESSTKPPVEHHVGAMAYFEFEPDSSDFSSVSQVRVDFAYQLDSLTIVTGRDPITDCGMFIAEDSINGWGPRLYAFNAQKEQLYQSRRMGEVYLFKPHFYRNNTNEKILIVCRVAMEYDLGGEVFLLENGEINYVGEIPISGPDMEINLIDILEIHEVADELIFTFTSDSVFHSSPEVAEEIISSKGLSYRYKKGRFELNR